MEPEASTPKLEKEQAPAEYGPAIERGIEVGKPELGIETGAERREHTADAAAAAANAAASAPVLPLPVIGQQEPAQVQMIDPAGTPLTANDDDLIEKEWVDRAKKIVAETKDNPYLREAAVSQLQKDYQKKRYGRELSTPQ